MRIESQNLTPVQPPPRTSQTAAPARTAGVAPREDVQLSAAGSLMLAAQQALGAVPEVRAAQVSLFQGQLAAGRYRVQPETVAQAMLAE